MKTIISEAVDTALQKDIFPFQEALLEVDLVRAVQKPYESNEARNAQVFRDHPPTRQIMICNPKGIRTKRHHVLFGLVEDSIPPLLTSDHVTIPIFGIPTTVAQSRGLVTIRARHPEIRLARKKEKERQRRRG